MAPLEAASRNGTLVAPGKKAASTVAGWAFRKPRTHRPIRMEAVPTPRVELSPCGFTRRRRSSSHMALLQDADAARSWFAAVSTVYDPIVGPLFWPVRVQGEVLDRVGIDEDDHVLDVGCGTGTTAAFAADRGATVSAIDQSRSQLERATTKANDVRFIRGDAQQLPCDDETFDTVVSVGSILYWPDPAAALAEMHRVTKPGGRVSVLGFHDPPVSLSNPLASATAAPTRTLYYCYDAHEARRLFSAAGWTAIECYRTGPAWHPQLALGTVAERPD